MSYLNRPKLSFFAMLYMLLVIVVCLLLLIMPFGFAKNITDTIHSGFVNGTNVGIGISTIMIISLLLIPSFFISTLRNIYKVFPWLLPFVVILSTNLIIMAAALEIINKGFEIRDFDRHHLFIILMLAQVILCRLAMSIYFYFNPMTNKGIE